MFVLLSVASRKSALMLWLLNHDLTNEYGSRNIYHFLRVEA